MDDVIRRHPDRVPVQIHDESDFDVDRKKYLIPKDMSLRDFITYIRKRIKLRPCEALFIIMGDILPPISSTFGDLYREHADDDKLLYIILKKESTFG